MNDNKSVRVSLDGLTPEEALKALLAVRPAPDDDDAADRRDDGPEDTTKPT